VAHGEGKFVAPPEVLDRVDVALYYADETGLPCTAISGLSQGSVRAIAGITDTLPGAVFGLMPHPEDHINRQQHPRWTRAMPNGVGNGLKISRTPWRGLKSPSRVLKREGCRPRPSYEESPLCAGDRHGGLS
jgi:phosphoribosylformylglycinamidine synthase